MLIYTMETIKGIEAYGGNGKVQSSEIWTLFRHNFEKDIVNIKMNYHITTYN